jgi:hypothetical protein
MDPATGLHSGNVIVLGGNSGNHAAKLRALVFPGTFDSLQDSDSDSK